MPTSTLPSEEIDAQPAARQETFEEFVKEAVRLFPQPLVIPDVLRPEFGK